MAAGRLAGMSSRRGARPVGLSKYDKPDRLLKIINFPKTAAKPAGKPARDTKKRIRTPEKEADILAPPVSSDDSDSGEDKLATASKARRKVEDPISSEDEREDSPDRGDIQPATFQSSWNSATSFSSSTRSKTKYGSKKNDMKYGSARSSQESKTSSQKKRNADASGDDLSPVRSQSLLRDPDKKYGSQIKRVSPPSSQPSRDKKRAKKPVEGEEARLA